MHDPSILILRIPGVLQLWHIDPEKDGTDDSCGWFMRARHGDPEMLKKIRKRFAYDWDSTFTSEESKATYFTGWFCPNGDPHLSPHGIGINMFWMAAYEMMGRRKANRYLSRNIGNILFFAENNTDSLHDSITRKFETGCGEYQTEKSREDRIDYFASIIYGYILRDIRPWWKEPRFHVHHWRISLNIRLRRRNPQASTLQEPS